MPFEKTKASSAKHTEEDVEKDLNEEEETSTEGGHSDKNEDESEGDTSKDEEESDEGSDEGSDENDEEDDEDTDEDELVVPEGVDPVEFWKKQALKEKQEKENYKTGLISKKAKGRGLQKEAPKETKPDVNEEIVMGVLHKQNEKTVLRNVIDSKHEDYIPELVDDDQYSEIIGYLPRNLDKSKPESIVKALKIATKMWKEDHGIVDKVAKKKNDLHTTKSSSSGAATKEQKKEGRKILKKTGGPETWYS